VSFAGPAGSVEVPQPQIVFSKPMRALGQKSDEPRLEATFSPPVRGHWEWIGSSAARFVPDDGFAEATAYTMEIAPGLRALDGETLAGPVRLAFSTVPPKLVSHSPEDDQTEVALRESIQLTFNQVISRPELEAGVTVVNRAGQVLPFTVEQNGDSWGSSVQLKPRETWPDADKITVRFADGIRGEHGLLPMKARQISFETLSSLHVTGLDCSLRRDKRCQHWTSVSVQLSDDMRPSDFWPLVKVTPRLTLRHPREGHDEPTRWFTLDADFKPGETYTVEVVPSRRPPAPPPRRRGEEIVTLRPLREGAKADFVFAPQGTGVDFNFHSTFVPFSHDELAAKAEETKKASVGVAVLDREVVMKLEASHPDKDLVWEMKGLQTLALPIRANEKAPPAWQTLKDLAPDRPGPVLFGARWEGVEGVERIQKVLQRTDLSFHHRDAPGETLVWVTSLQAGMPVEGVAVEARDFEGHAVAGTTDKDGVVTLVTSGLGKPLASGESPWQSAQTSMVLFAQKGDDWIYSDATRPAPPLPHGALFTERGLYRPGESVSIKGLVRQPTKEGFETLEGKEITLVISAPGGRATRATLTAGPYGTFQHEFAIGEDGSLGNYSISAQINDRSVGTASFKVKEYRPSSFSVEAALDRPVYARGESATCSVRGSYLYGGSLLGSKASVQLTRSRLSFQIPGLTGYTTADTERSSSFLPDRRREGKLDAAGQISFDFPLDADDQQGTEQISCNVAVTDAGLDMVGARATAIVHPSDVYVALEDLRWGRLGRNEGVSPKLLVVTPDGVRRNQPVRVELVEYRRVPTRHEASLPGKVVSSCEVTTKSDPVTCRVIAPAAAQDDVTHYTLRATTKDARGRSITSSVRMNPGEPLRKPKPVVEPKIKEQPQPKLVAVQNAVPRGERAFLKASSPFEHGEALITFERDGILGHQVLPVGLDPVDVEFKMGEGTAPFVNVQAFYVSPYSDRRDHRRAMQARSWVTTGWQEHRLELSVKPAKTRAVPGEEMDVDVEVHGADGAPVKAEVTLYAADEATLALASYQLPDPLDSFFEKRPSSVTGGMTRDELGALFDWKEELRQFGLGSIGTIGHGSGTGSGMGFGSGHGRLSGDHRDGARSSEPRRNFRQTAFFLPSLQTDEKGHVRAHVQLPDSLTTYRVMAFAVTKGIDMGAAQSSIVTSKPLQVRPVLPRVIRAGDRFVLAAMAANNGTTRLDAEVSLEATGLVLKGPARQAVALAPGASQRLTFEVEAPQAGKGGVVLRIKGGEGLDDGAELPLVIESPITVETSALYGTAEGRVDEQLGDLSAVRPDTGGLDLSLSSSPLTGLGAGLEQLVVYPYGCTEQTTSRLVPLLPLRSLARALGVALPADLDHATEEAVRRLASHQQRDGGFGLWPDSSGSSPWLSAYATWGLTEAVRYKVPVDPQVIEQARHYLLGVLGRWQGGADEQRVTGPFALDVLAGATHDASASGLKIIADQLFQGREGLPVFSRALLLHAMGTLGSPGHDIETLTTELTSSLHLDGPLARHVGESASYSALLDSSVRTSALVLRSLVLVAPRHPLVKPLAMGLLADRKGGTWRTTQESAWALLALDDYRRMLGEGATHLDGEVKLGEVSLLQHSFEADPGALAPEAHATVPMAQLLGAAGKDLSFLGQGSSPLYYEARLRFAPRDLPSADVSAGFEIHRRHILVPAQIPSDDQQLESWRVDAARFKEGDLILDEVEVVTTSTRRFVVIDDPIPGGFESVDLDLQGGPRWVRPLLRGYQTRVERRDDRVVFFLDEMGPGAYRYRHLVRATAAGRFLVPPARVEEMYTPETYGLTAGRVVTID
jgi:hypothetical protein